MGVRFNIHALSPISGSLILSLILIFWDAVISGSYMFSALVCPVWFLVALFRAGISPAAPGVSPARILAPVFTLILVIANANIQIAIAEANAAKVIRACERYHEANGAYPNKLADLIPHYLSSIPMAKYCLMEGEFTYWGPPQTQNPMLKWVQLPPFGRQIYDFERHDWGYVD
ncbi:MAG TPA: hypothetical protein VGI75_03300 [Pirellulales bacterium]